MELISCIEANFIARPKQKMLIITSYGRIIREVYLILFFQGDEGLFLRRKPKRHELENIGHKKRSWLWRKRPYSCASTAYLTINMWLWKVMHRSLGFCMNSCSDIPWLRLESWEVNHLCDDHDSYLKVVSNHFWREWFSYDYSDTCCCSARRMFCCLFG